MLRSHASRFVVASGLLFALLILPLAWSVSAQVRDTDAGANVPAQALSTPQQLLADAAQRPAAEKLDASLDAVLADKDGREDGQIVILRSAERLTDLPGGVQLLREVRWPAGERLTVVKTAAKNVAALAEIPGVASVESGDPMMDRMPDFRLEGPDEDLAPQYEALPYADLRAMADAAPAWSETAALLGDEPIGIGIAAGSPNTVVDAADPGARPDGWVDVRQGHAAMEAWDLGITGKGVKVAVMDTSVDFAHQDLQESWAVLGESSGAMAGWPQVYDPNSVYIYGIDVADDTQQPTNEAFSGILQTTQEVELSEVEATGTYTGCVSTAADVVVNNALQRQLTEPQCDFILPESKSGKVLVGSHPDTFLASLRQDMESAPPVFRQFVAVVLVDANEAGVYDTVYVDLNNDHNLTNDKPVTKESPLSWGEFGEPDGIADLSGGLLYYIADGESPVPGAYLWESPENQLPVPEQYSYVAFHYDTGGHGTLCASNVASRGRLGVPDRATLSFEDLPGDGQPMPVNPGMAPEAELVAMGNIYAGPLAVMDSAWRYGVLGNDPDNPDDDPQITSNSYGFSNVDNDGWDPNSRSIDYYVRSWNPSNVGMYSTGNGGAGYGTLAPPAPRTGMGICASTQMGSTGWDSADFTSQITFGDVTPWSNRGPGAVGDNGPTACTDGAYAAGANPINSITTNAQRPEYLRSGAYANSTWGGTSRSGPVGAGIMALVYQAFYQVNDRWPTWMEARQIAMSSARFQGYDPLATGAGVMDAGDAVRMALNLTGVNASPPEWVAGDYRGDRFESFTKLVGQGDERTETFTLYNHGATETAVTISSQHLVMTGSDTIDFQSAAVTDESPYTFNAPDYLIKVDDTKIPEGTDLLLVRMIRPLEQVDGSVSPDNPDGNQQMTNAWRLGVWQHTDHNDDQLLWEDLDGDGAVDASPAMDDTTDPPSPIFTGLEATTPAVDYETAEIQEGEYMRFAYHNNAAPGLEVRVHHPLERWSSGIYVGLWHHSAGRPAEPAQSDFQFRLEYFDFQEYEWLTSSNAELTIPAADGATPGMATFDATLAIPEDAPLGVYQSAIFVDYARAEGDEPVSAPAGYELENQRTVIPILANVSEPFSWEGSLTFGGEDAHDGAMPYSNGAVQGTQSWTWRPESGDWRFFFFDIEEEPAPGSYLVTRTTWSDEGDESGQQNDIDTQIFGPDVDRYSDPDHEENEDEDRSDPEFYGPYTMESIGGSARLNAGGGRWPFQTSSGGPEDWNAAAVEHAGLHEIMLHNVLFSGKQFDLPFEVNVGSVNMLPQALTLYGAECAPVQITSYIEMPDFSGVAVGLSSPTVYEDQEVGQDDPNDPNSAGWKQVYDLPTDAPQMSVVLDSHAEEGSPVDLDLWLLYDADGDGTVVYPADLLASSTTPTGNEQIQINDADAGSYHIWVQGWNVPGDSTTFDLTIDAVYGDDLEVTGLPEKVTPGQPFTVQVCAKEDAVEGLTEESSGEAFFGPGGAPQLLSLPITWKPESEKPDPNLIYLPSLLKNYEAAGQ